MYRGGGQQKVLGREREEEKGREGLKIERSMRVDHVNGKGGSRLVEKEEEALSLSGALFFFFYFL